MVNGFNDLVKELSQHGAWMIELNLVWWTGVGIWWMNEWQLIWMRKYGGRLVACTICCFVSSSIFAFHLTLYPPLRHVPSYLRFFIFLKLPLQFCQTPYFLNYFFNFAKHLKAHFIMILENIFNIWKFLSFKC